MATAVQETQSSCILCNYNDVKKVVALTKTCPTLKTIVYTFNNVEESKWGTSPEGADTAGIVIMSMEDVIKLGLDNPISYTPPKPETVLLLQQVAWVVQLMCVCSEGWEG